VQKSKFGIEADAGDSQARVGGISCAGEPVIENYINVT
jgi:hypothetical protein